MFIFYPLFLKVYSFTSCIQALLISSIFYIGMRTDFFFSGPHRYPIVLAPFIEKITFAPSYCLCSFVKDQQTTCGCISEVSTLHGSMCSFICQNAISLNTVVLHYVLKSVSHLFISFNIEYAILIVYLFIYILESAFDIHKITC